MKVYYFFLIIFCGFFSLSGQVLSEESEFRSEKKPLIVFLVRHAEKENLSSDAKLSSAGEIRAVALSNVLQNAKVDYIHSTNFIRTRKTAEPTAIKYGVDVTLYDYKNLKLLVENLHKLGGRHLVVGHSNTTPKMVSLLGGNPQSEINEKKEFDRLYVITIGKNGEINSIMMRYGAPSEF